MVENMASTHLAKLDLMATSRGGAEAWVPRDGINSGWRFLRLNWVFIVSGEIGGYRALVEFPPNPLVRPA